MPKEADPIDNPQTLAASLYKQNVEILGKNKTLSLLTKLYEISVLALDPKELAAKVAETVQVDLSFEVVGILMHDKEKSILTPLGFTVSERISKVGVKNNITLNELVINLAKNSFFNSIIEKKKLSSDEDLKEVWGGVIESEILKEVTEAGHIKDTIVYPLLIQNEVIGVLVISFNRLYEDLAEYEKESLNSSINAIAVALDKALLYQQLQTANEQLKALDKARAEFISIASHQLRTPPATIKWYIGAVLAGDFGPLTDDLKAALQRTNVTNDAQISTIDDLLNASRIERGKLEFFFEKNPLEPVVSSLIEQLQPLANMKKMNIIYHKPSAPLPDILLDKEKVRQVLNNMIDNAIKYSKEGDINVTLKNDGENLVVSVQDTGKGISKEEVGKLFQKYARGSDSVTHATGLGLGMYVAKVVVEQHGGKIWAESPGVGRGSTFYFSLPIQSDLKPTTVDLVASASEPDPAK
jgi:signal transduction histidine kinase